MGVSLPRVLSLAAVIMPIAACSWFNSFFYFDNNPLSMRKLVYILFLSIIFFLTPACHHAGDEHEHEHHHDAVQYTAYGADFELFAEAAVLAMLLRSPFTLRGFLISNRSILLKLKSA